MLHIKYKCIDSVRYTPSQEKKEGKEEGKEKKTCVGWSIKITIQSSNPRCKFKYLIYTTQFLNWKHRNNHIWWKIKVKYDWSVKTNLYI